jgi:hypothetical protein
MFTVTTETPDSKFEESPVISCVKTTKESSLS